MIINIIVIVRVRVTVIVIYIVVIMIVLARGCRMPARVARSTRRDARGTTGNDIGAIRIYIYI